MATSAEELLEQATAAAGDDEGPAASAVPMIDMPMPASPQKSSSLTIGSPSPDSSAQNWAMPSKP